MTYTLVNHLPVEKVKELLYILVNCNVDTAVEAMIEDGFISTSLVD